MKLGSFNISQSGADTQRKKKKKKKNLSLKDCVSINEK